MRDRTGAPAGALRQLLILEIPAEDFTGVLRHRTVEKNRHICEPACRLQALEIIEQALRAPDGKGWNDNGAAAADRSADDVRERLFRVHLGVQSIAVGRLDDKIVSMFDLNRIDHRGVVVASEIAGKDDGAVAQFKLNRRGSQNMTGPAKPHADPTLNRIVLVERQRPQELKSASRVLLRVQRQRRLVLREAMAVGEFGVFFLQMPGIRQEYPAQIDGGPRAEDASREPLFDQKRQGTGVIEMRMCQNSGRDAARLERKRGPVSQA